MSRDSAMGRGVTIQDIDSAVVTHRRLTRGHVLGQNEVGATGWGQKALTGGSDTLLVARLDSTYNGVGCM